MSVEVALSVMAAARTGRLVVCDQDDQCTGLVTRMELTAVRDSSAYTDRVRLRDILGDHRSFTSPVTTMAEAEHAMRSRRLGALPVVDGQRQPPGRPRPLRLNRLTLVGPFSPSPCEATWAASSRFPFELTENGVLESMKGIKPEPGTGVSVIIGRRHYPVKQVGQVITRQDRRDLSAAEVLRAMTRLGFTCRTLPTAAPVRILSSLQQASAMLGTPVSV